MRVSTSAELSNFSRSIFEKPNFFLLSRQVSRFLFVSRILSAAALLFLSFWVPEFLICSCAADYCWVPVFLTSSCAVLQRLLLQFKIDLSNFLILVDRVANWGKLKKAIFLYFMVIEGFSSSKDISDLRVTSGSWDSTVDFIKDHRG